MRRRAFDDIDHRGAPSWALAVMSKKTISSAALVIVTNGQFHRIADIAQTTVLSPAKLHASRHFSIVNIEAGNYAFGQHKFYKYRNESGIR